MNPSTIVGTFDWTRRTGGRLEPGQRRRLVLDLTRVHGGNALGRLGMLARVNRGRTA